jgi:hypothetical protein
VAAAAVLVTGGVLVSQAGNGGVSDTSGDLSAGPRTLSTGTDYTRGSLPAGLRLLLGGTAGSGTGASVSGGTAGDARTGEPSSGSAEVAPSISALSSPPGDPLAGLRTSAGLARCLTALLDPGADVEEVLPLAVDYASYEGQAALVVVLPADKPDKVDVYVVGAGCSPADAQLLYFTRLARP